MLHERYEEIIIWFNLMLSFDFSEENIDIMVSFFRSILKSLSCYIKVACAYMTQTSDSFQDQLLIIFVFICKIRQHLWRQGGFFWRLERWPISTYTTLSVHKVAFWSGNVLFSLLYHFFLGLLCTCTNKD